MTARKSIAEHTKGFIAGLYRYPKHLTAANETLTQPQRTWHRALRLRYQLVLVPVDKDYACDDDQHADDHEQNDRAALQLFEFAARPVRAQTINCRPNTRADSISQQEVAPRHDIGAGERPSKGSQHRHKLCGENDFRRHVARTDIAQV